MSFGTDLRYSVNCLNQTIILSVLDIIGFLIIKYSNLKDFQSDFFKEKWRQSKVSSLSLPLQNALGVL